MFIKIKIARIYRKNIIIYMGVEEEQLGGKRRVYKSVKKAKVVGKPKKVVKAMKAMKVAPKRTGLSRLKPMYRGRLGMHLGGQQGMGLAGMFGALTTPQQTAAPTAPAAPPATPAPVATPQQVAAFTQQMHQYQQRAEEVTGGRPRRHRSRSPSKVVKAKPKARLARPAGKMMKPRAKKYSSRGGFEEEQEQEQEEMEFKQEGGFQQLQALESLVSSLSGGGYGRKRVVRHRPVVRRSPSPVARRRRPSARRT
jgi:hypothetical protein